MFDAVHIIERRTKPRIETKVRVKVVGEGGYETYSGNLSKSGVFLETTEPFAEAGAKVQLQILLPNSSDPVKVSGQVIRVLGPNRVKTAAGIAISFTRVEARHARTFDKLIDRLLDARGIGCRKYPRVQTQVMVELRTKNDIRNAISDNVSKGGLFLKMPVGGLVLGDTLNIVISHPTAKRKFVIDGEVVHVRKGESMVREDFIEGVGVQFTDVSPTRRNDMALFLRSILGAKKRPPNP